MGEELIGGKKACCRDEANLRVVEHIGDRLMRRCVVCGCRHFEFTVDPGSLGMKMAPLTGPQQGA
jgi:hypothetical protein